MMNYKKTGYSVPEVAQILRVTPATIRSWINNGRIKANVEGVITKGKKRKLRITREQLSDFIKKNKSYYDQETYDTFVIAEARAASEEAEKQKKTVAIFDPMPKQLDATDFEVNDISKLTGAWSSIVKPETPKPTTESKKDLTPTTKKEKQPTLLIDGRITLGNIEKETLRIIINALLEDKQFNPDSIAIKFN